MSIKTILLVTGLGLLAGCVWIDHKVYTHSVQSTSLMYNEATLNSFRTVIPDLEIPTVEPKPACKAFVPPERRELPVVPSFSIPEIPIEDQLAQYINSLRNVIKAERRELDQALAEYQRNCPE